MEKSNFCPETFDKSFWLSKKDHACRSFMHASNPFFFTGNSRLCDFLKTCHCEHCKGIQMPTEMCFLFLISFWLLMKDAIEVTKSTVSHSLLQFHLNQRSFVSVKPCSTAFRPFLCLMNDLQGTLSLQQ